MLSLGLRMEEESVHSQNVSVPSASNSSSEPVREEEDQEEEELAGQPRDEDHHRQNQHHHHHHHQHHRHHRPSGVSYRVSMSFSDRASANARENTLSCLAVVVTFWFLASVTLILGIYGSGNLPLGPNCSRLVQASSLFVQSIKVQEIGYSKDGPMLYGFYEPPPLDVEITWFETHNAVILSSFHEEWLYFLNTGSEVDISYSVKSPSSLPLSLVIAKGRNNLVDWIDDPSNPNNTLSWSVIHGTGRIHQEILTSTTYYIAVGNLNFEKVEVQLNFTIKGFFYNTSHAHYKCSLSHRSCSVKLFLLRKNAAVLTSPGPQQGVPYDDWYVRLSYGPQWITYFVGSGALTLLIVLTYRMCKFQINNGGSTGFQAGDMGSESVPLLSPKDDDLSSWDSSWDSTSHDEEELNDRLAVASLDGKPLKEGESNSNSHRQCSICFDAPRDCFFIPCGHCAACFTCATRIVEEDGTCPICRRTMKKVRKIFTV